MHMSKVYLYYEYYIEIFTNEMLGYFSCHNFSIEYQLSMMKKIYEKFRKGERLDQINFTENQSLVSSAKNLNFPSAVVSFNRNIPHTSSL